MIILAITNNASLRYKSVSADPDDMDSDYIEVFHEQINSDNNNYLYRALQVTEGIKAVRKTSPNGQEEKFALLPFRNFNLPNIAATLNNTPTNVFQSVNVNVFANDMFVELNLSISEITRTALNANDIITIDVDQIPNEFIPNWGVSTAIWDLGTGNPNPGAVYLMLDDDSKLRLFMARTIPAGTQIYIHITLMYVKNISNTWITR